jgi:hypothetical protein
MPVRLEDGTVSDGKTQSYDRCVEAILGNPETFFTSVFSAQNRRPLASYANAEIKALMVDLLGLERIRRWEGERARSSNFCDHSSMKGGARSRQSTRRRISLRYPKRNKRSLLQNPQRLLFVLRPFWRSKAQTGCG